MKESTLAKIHSDRRGYHRALPKEIGEYEQVAEFLVSCKSVKTSSGYKTAISRFFNFTAVSNPGLEFDPEKALKMPVAELNTYVLKYAMHLKKVAKTTEEYKRGEVHVNSIPYYINPLKSFFDYHDITLSWKKIRRFIPEKTKVKYHVYSKEEIKRLLDAANYREKVIILLLESSGMRAEAMLELQIKDFEVLENDIGHLIVYARSPAYYHTFCTPECTKAIKFYLTWRQEMEEGETLNPTAPLIRDHIFFKGSKQARTPSRMTYHRLYQIITKLLRNANVSHTKLQPNHSFRKFLNTTVANAKANPLFKEIMMGHSIKLDNTYYDRENPESLKALFQEYLRAVDMLTINDEYRLRKEVVILQEKLKDAPKLEVIQNDLISSRLENDGMRRMLMEMKEEMEMLKKWRKGQIKPTDAEEQTSKA